MRVEGVRSVWGPGGRGGQGEGGRRWLCLHWVEVGGSSPVRHVLKR